MSQISAIAPVTASVKAPAMQAAPAAEAAPLEAPRKAEENAPIALAPNGISRVIMDARAEYDCGTKLGGPDTRDFDRLAYVLEGLEHMRRMIQAGQVQPEQPMPVTPAEALELFANAGQGAAPAVGGAMDISV